MSNLTLCGHRRDLGYGRQAGACIKRLRPNIDFRAQGKIEYLIASTFRVGFKASRERGQNCGIQYGRT